MRSGTRDTQNLQVHDPSFTSSYCYRFPVNPLMHYWNYNWTSIELMLWFWCRERDILVHVNQVAPLFQNGMKKFANSLIIGEVGLWALQISDFFCVELHYLVGMWGWTSLWRCKLACLIMDCKQVRGEGLVLGIEFVGDKETKKSFPADWGMAVSIHTFCCIFFMWRCNLDLCQLSKIVMS